MRANRRGVLAAGLVAGLVLGLVAACGGDDAVPPETWAKSVCKAVKPWSAEIGRLQSATRQKITARSDIGQTKTELITLFGGMAQATDTALAKVREAGVPDVDDGRKIADQFVSALTAARDSFVKGKNAVAALPTDDQKVFYDGVLAAGDAMSQENAKAGQAFSDISSPELDKAFEEVPECR